jgi:hypothetical protein
MGISSDHFHRVKIIVSTNFLLLHGDNDLEQSSLEYGIEQPSSMSRRWQKMDNIMRERDTP